MSYMCVGFCVLNVVVMVSCVCCGGVVGLFVGTLFQLLVGVNDVIW